MKKTYRFLVIGLITSTLALVGFKYEDRYFEIAKNLDIFATLFKELNALYVDEINPNKAMRTSITSMLKELDPYTNFYPEDDIEDYRTMATGKYNGIGATVSNVYGDHTVVMIYEGSPADKGGIKIGDVFTEINGVSLAGRDSEQLGRLLKGQTDTEVDLTIKRYGQKKPLELSVKRAVVKTPNVPHYGLINDEVGYIQLNDFSATAASEIKTAFEEMKGQGMKSLVLDLRGNPGGLLNMAIDICNFFIPKGELVVETKGKVGQWNKKYAARFNPIDLEMPIAVLINSGSASASEIVSGTLQDYDRGVVIGQKSFGKGLVQTTRPLSFNTQLKVTTAKYYIPSGRCIQAIDYSHRNADGSVGKVPDSLKSTFYTKNGRPVYDGGGVDPDIDLEPKELSELTAQLISKGVIFDFATQYYFKNELNIPGDNFTPSDDLYTAFKEYVKTSGFAYVNEAEEALAELESLASEDKGYAGFKSSLSPLRTMLNKKKDMDMMTYQDEIKDELALEILSRYHYDNAMKFVSFEKDHEVQEALKLFKDMPRYKSILAGK
ncbi:S41 family peptidase [Arcticibacterium luteifluviistationis]|uniref:Peptidase S41 n=1 Tax=Arcticibacterium luteifluviistationis TaxID=1784714 RepID=A0A2Z4GCS7_9BACT|nr:S41 family peptidase [Arcticibacterium luteifluviistationis]AWV99112.1 peptidase S41 [Arcticibacterium luteifluviistationis]